MTLDGIEQYLRDNERRFASTFELIQGIYGGTIPPIRIAALGGAGELLPLMAAGASVDTYDTDPWFKPTAAGAGIGWYHADFNAYSRLWGRPYDMVLMCQVLAHITRNPIDVLREVADSLVPGGYLVVSTQHLHRLSQRARMLFGRPIFAPWLVGGKQSFINEAHMREYSVAEVGDMLRGAGFTIESWHYAICMPWSWRVMFYRAICKFLPGLSPLAFFVATKPTSKDDNMVSTMRTAQEFIE